MLYLSSLSLSLSLSHYVHRFIFSNDHNKSTCLFICNLLMNFFLVCADALEISSHCLSSPNKYQITKYINTYVLYTQASLVTLFSLLDRILHFCIHHTLSQVNITEFDSFRSIRRTYSISIYRYFIDAGIHQYTYLYRSN